MNHRMISTSMVAAQLTGKHMYIEASDCNLGNTIEIQAILMPQIPATIRMVGKVE